MTQGAAVWQLCLAHVPNAARAFHKGASIGADAISFQEIAEAIEEALEELWSIMDRSLEPIAQEAWRHAAHCQLHCLLLLVHRSLER